MYDDIQSAKNQKIIFTSSGYRRRITHITNNPDNNIFNIAIMGLIQTTLEDIRQYDIGPSRQSIDRQ